MVYNTKSISQIKEEWFINREINSLPEHWRGEEVISLCRSNGYKPYWSETYEYQFIPAIILHLWETFEINGVLTYDHVNDKALIHLCITSDDKAFIRLKGLKEVPQKNWGGLSDDVYVYHINHIMYKKIKSLQKLCDGFVFRMRKDV